MEKNEIRPLQIIYTAMTMGLSVFAVIAAIISYQAFQKALVPTVGQIRVVKILGLVLLLYGCIGYVLANFLFRKGVGSLSEFAPVAKGGKIKTAYIIRIALFVGIAVLGLIVVLIGGLHNVFQSNPIYLLGYVPYFVFLSMVSQTYPTKEKLDTIINGVGGNSFA